ncbi:hypothetical protein V5799_024817 [Amblyomma americanum]|uniref:Uncharacterized protein n=1 Tax=Amblyomma americanum TaxID=6943 RepID=A0AAQ4EAX7_AMBAM
MASRRSAGFLDGRKPSCSHVFAQPLAARAQAPARGSSCSHHWAVVDFVATDSWQLARAPRPAHIIPFETDAAARGASQASFAAADFKAMGDS